MPSARHAHSHRASHDNGTETTATPCLGHSYVYDVLFDQHSGPEWEYAVSAARGLCGGCPIRVTCHREHRREPWVKAIRGRRRLTKAAA